MSKKTALRWLPFLLVLLAFAGFAEVGDWRFLFVRRFGEQVWDSLHWYASGLLVFFAFLAQPPTRRLGPRAGLALLLTLLLGVFREVYQHFGPHRFGLEDLLANVGGSAVGLVASLLWERFLGRRTKKETE